MMDVRTLVITCRYVCLQCISLLDAFVDSVSRKLERGMFCLTTLLIAKVMSQGVIQRVSHNLHVRTIFRLYQCTRGRSWKAFRERGLITNKRTCCNSMTEIRSHHIRERSFILLLHGCFVRCLLKCASQSLSSQPPVLCNVYDRWRTGTMILSG